LSLYGAEDEVAYAARFEGGGGLKVLKFEEDTAGGGLGGVLSWLRVGLGPGTYQPAALERAIDSTRGVSIQGFVLGTGSATEPIFAVPNLYVNWVLRPGIYLGGHSWFLYRSIVEWIPNAFIDKS